MKNILAWFMRKLNQRQLLKQIVEFLEDPKYNKGPKRENGEWLIELQHCTNARNLKGITWNDLQVFYEHVRQRESSQFFRLQAAKSVRKFYQKGIKDGWVKHFPTETNTKDNKGDNKDEFMSKIVAGMKRTRMPNEKMVREVRALRKMRPDGTRLAFRKVIEVLEGRYHKKFYLPTVVAWYHTKRV